MISFLPEMMRLLVFKTKPSKLETVNENILISLTILSMRTLQQALFTPLMISLKVDD